MRSIRRIRLAAAVLLAAVITLAACGPQADIDRITELVVSPPEATLKVGSDENSTAQLNAIIHYKSGETERADVSWESGDPEIATVSADGLVTAIGEGETIVTATTTELASERSATAVITVEPGDGTEPAAESLTVTPSELELGIGGIKRLTASVTLADGSSKRAENMGWSSRKPSIATVSDDGLVTAVASGTTTIIGTSGDYPDLGEVSVSVTVLATPAPEATALTVTPSMLELDIGETGQLTATVDFDDGSSDTAGNMVWTSSKPSVATISSSGVVTALAAGAATMTGTSGDYPGLDEVSVAVTVLAAPEAVSLTVNTGNLVLRLGETETGQLTGTVNFDDDSSKPAENMTWTSSETSVATVSNDGVVSAVATGTATITGTSVDHPDLDEVTVTVGVVPATLDTANVYVGLYVADPLSAEGTKANPFETIEEGVDEVAQDGTVHIADGTYPLSGTLRILKPLSLLGESEDGVVITSGLETYSIEITGGGSGVSLENLTIDGSGAGVGSNPGQQFGVRAADVADFSMTNVTVQGFVRHEVDLNVVEGAVLTDVTLDGQGRPGVGLALTDTTDIDLIRLTTMGNDWGGIGIWPTSLGTVSGVNIDSGSTLDDDLPIYLQTKGPNSTAQNLTLAGFDFAVRNPQHKDPSEGDFTFYFDSDERANVYAVGTAGPIGSSTIQRVDPADAATLLNEYLVFDDMSILAALAAVAQDGTIYLANGTHNLPEFTGSNPQERFGIYIAGADHEGITIRGESQEDVIIDATANGYTHGIRVKRPNVTLENFTLKGPAWDTGKGRGIQAQGSPAATSALLNLTIRNVTVDGSGETGLSLTVVDGASLENVTVKNSAKGITVKSSQNVTLQNIATEDNSLAGVSVETTTSGDPSGYHFDDVNNISFDTIASSRDTVPMMTVIHTSRAIAGLNFVDAPYTHKVTNTVPLQAIGDSALSGMPACDGDSDPFTYYVTSEAQGEGLEFCGGNSAPAPTIEEL